MKTPLKTSRIKRKLFFILLVAVLCTVLFSSASSEVLAEDTVESEPEYFMGILILESQQQAILDSINKIKKLELGNMVVLHPLDLDWKPDRIEEAIKEANDLGLYIIFETYNYSDHHVRISPQQFEIWQEKYPRLLGILVQEIMGKQVDLNVWLSKEAKNIETRLDAEEAVIKNITSSMQLAEFKEIGARTFLQENVISYASANTSYCDVLISKVFNAPNTELMISLARGMINSYDIPAWGLWVDTWREWQKPPAFTPSEVKHALYEGWFYGAKYFFFEQGNFFGTLNRDWDHKYIILGEDGKLTEYGKVIQEFYAFLKNEEKLGYEQPDYHSPIAIMIGQSGWSSRGQNWGLWDQNGTQGNFDYRLLNLFFPRIGDNWQIGQALTGKEFTGLPLGMIDVISIYAPASVLKQYKVIIGLGWSQISDVIANNIEEFVSDGGIFFSLLTFTHGNEKVDDLEDVQAWNKSFTSLFGVKVSPGILTSDDFLHNITFTQDTFWYPWNGKTYIYADSNEQDYWFLRFNYELSNSENTRIIAWVDGIQSAPNAFIIENKKGAGYTYVVNTRNPYSAEGVLINVLTDFVHHLCAYHVRPMVFSPYPQNDYWLSQGQSDRTIYLRHDNSTTFQSLTYYVRPLDAELNVNEDYIVFDYLNRQFYGVTTETIVPLEVELHSKDAKLFVFNEANGNPQVLHSNAILTDAPHFADQQLKVALNGVEEAENVTTIYCSELGTPQYILGSPYDFGEDYDFENKILSISYDSDIVIGWDNTTEIYVSESTASLTKVTWNSSFETLSVSVKGSIGQEASIQVQTEGIKPYYFKVNNEETPAWTYDASTGLMSANYTFTSDTIDLIFGFNPIRVDRFVVSDKRADVGSIQSVGFHVMLMSNESNVVGATVSVNGTEHVTNQTGWIIFEASNDEVKEVVWSVTGVDYNGLKAFTKTADNPRIVWDRIKIREVSIFDEIVQVDSLQTVWLTAEYEYDSTTFDDSKGIVFLNNEPMIWSSQNLRWEHNVTSKDVGRQGYEVTSVDDTDFGLTKIYNPNSTINILWDKIEISKIEFETDMLGVTSIKFDVKYKHSQNPVVNANVNVNNEICEENESGTYKCEIRNWSPIQNLIIKTETKNFEENTKNVVNIHVMNTILYVSIGLAIVLAVWYFLIRKKRQQIRDSVGREYVSNIRLLSIKHRRNGLGRD